MEKNRVCITVCGVDHVILSEKPAEYMQQLGAALHEQMQGLLRANGRMSVTQAAVLSALSFMDAAKEAETTAENLRSRIQDYLEDAARMKKEAELARHEAERLHRELAELKRRKPQN
ncbi:MAG: cell division protein ZapA [Oscillospiraceae bacterium]|jgi:cell division protein ZapA (FtsZ GTPase activity inhibitor)|nr:cell division protein ZapA [Oscillospiraceae bacterium]